MTVFYQKYLESYIRKTSHRYMSFEVESQISGILVKDSVKISNQSIQNELLSKGGKEMKDLLYRLNENPMHAQSHNSGSLQGALVPFVIEKKWS